jgi:hypothetical protein
VASDGDRGELLSRLSSAVKSGGFLKRSLWGAIDLTPQSADFVKIYGAPYGDRKGQG